MRNNKNKSEGMTLFEVVAYLALAGVFLVVALPTSLNIIALTQKHQRTAYDDQQFITILHTIEAMVRTDTDVDITSVLNRYADVVSSSSLITTTNVRTGIRTAVVSFLYQNNRYSYVYEY